jgi:phage minor structural protein
LFIDIDYNKKMKDYKIELSKPNKTIITNLSERMGAKLNVSLGSLGELTFQIPYKIENEYYEMIDNPNIDLLREKMYLRLTIGNQKMWFIVDNISDQTEDLDIMNIQAFSLPIELKNKKISELNLTSVNADMLMDELLVSSSWSKGTVDLELQSTYRTFDFSETTIYDALVSSAETFGAIIVWDEENKTISFRELTNISQYKGMNVNAEKFLNSLKRTRDTDEMVTRLYVYGNEKMSIQNVNPSGLRYIEDFSYFLEPFTRDANKNVLTHSNYMSDELCHAILDNKELKELALPQINTLQSEIIVLNSNLALKDIELTELKLSLSTTKGLLDIAKSTGDTALIAQRQSEVINFEALVSTKNSEIVTITSQINTKTNEMTALQDSVSITSFTPELLDELDAYIVEKDFYDDRYIDETELYNAGINKFAEIRSPKIVVEISIDNLLNVVEEQYYWDKIVLGDMIQVKYPNMKINYKSTIVGLDFDLDEMDCSVKIANHTDNLDSIDKLVSIIYENQSTSLTISNNKYKWDSIIDVRDRVDQLRDGEIDAVKNRIKAGVNESVNIGDNGIVLTNPNFPEEMVIMQAGVIALTRDGGETWNTSITPRGVIAETIIGNLIAGNELVITNSSGTFVMDASGLTIDADNIFINSGDTQTPENLVEYWNSMSLTMAEFSNDNVINKYEKQQIKKQWDNIVSVHNSMIDKFYAEIGTETAENPYPVEYDIYMAKYEALNTYLNTTLQSDGFSILNALNADNTTTINPLVYNTKFSEFSKAKDDFQIVIPMEYTKASISVLESGINLNYVKNNNVVSMINLSEEGVRIDGKLLTIDAETHFNNDLVMNAGVIKSADGGTVLDLNNNTFTFDKPFTIGVSNVATVEDVEDVAYEIEQKADSGAVADAINDVATSAANAQSTANSKLDKSSYDNFINEYIDYKKAIASEQSASSKNLQDAKDAISLITNNMGDMKESWKFNNGTQIDATGNGMLLSDGTGGMNLLLSNNRISFFDSGVEVAYIADKTLKINHGIFVKSAQIGAHLISSSTSNPDITIVSWVGI